MKSISSFFVVLGIVVLSGPAFAIEPLSGLWMGVYKYEANGHGVPFSAVIEGEGQGRFVHGTMIEPNTFGSHEATALGANLHGRVDVSREEMKSPQMQRGEGERRGERSKSKAKGKAKAKGEREGGEAGAKQRGGVAKQAPAVTRIQFVKIYDGSGGVTHSVWYSGVIDAEGDVIRGVWELDGGMSGPFLMKRVVGE